MERNERDWKRETVAQRRERTRKPMCLQTEKEGSWGREEVQGPASRVVRQTGTVAKNIECLGRAWGLLEKAQECGEVWQ